MIVEGTTVQVSSISAMPWHLCFMFVHIFVLLLPVPKPTTKEIDPCQGLCAS